MNLDEAILSYSREKGKCKFCRHEIKPETMKTLEKSQGDRMIRAERELIALKELRASRIE